MNDQQTKYIEELNALEQLRNITNSSILTAERTMPLAGTELALAISSGLKIKDMDEDQQFYYKKFNLRIRTLVALTVTYRWVDLEIERHKAMAPNGENEGEG